FASLFSVLVTPSSIPPNWQTGGGSYHRPSRSELAHRPRGCFAARARRFSWTVCLHRLTLQWAHRRLAGCRSGSWCRAVPMTFFSPESANLASGSRKTLLLHCSPRCLGSAITEAGVRQTCRRRQVGLCTASLLTRSRNG